MNRDDVMETGKSAGAAGWRPEVERAVRDLAAALSQTPEAEAFQLAFARFRDDGPAQEAMLAYEAEQRALQPLLMLGAATGEQRAGLERLRRAALGQPSTAAYLKAQDTLMALARAVDGVLSEKVRLGFAASCRPRCCG